MDPVLRRLVDRDAIVDLHSRFAATIDACEYDGLRELFTPEAIVDFGPDEHWEGIDRIVERMAEINATHQGSHRMMTNHRIELDGDRARAVALYRSAHLDASNAEPGSFYRATHSHEGWYLSDLSRTADRWRIAYLKHETLSRADLGTPQGRATIAEIARHVDLAAVYRVGRSLSSNHPIGRSRGVPRNFSSAAEVPDGS